MLLYYYIILNIPAIRPLIIGNSILILFFFSRNRLPAFLQIKRTRKKLLQNLLVQDLLLKKQPLIKVPLHQQLQIEVPLQKQLLLRNPLLGRPLQKREGSTMDQKLLPSSLQPTKKSVSDDSWVILRTMEFRTKCGTKKGN